MLINTKKSNERSVYTKSWSITKRKSIVDFFTGAGTGIVASCLFSPDSSIRTTAIIVGIIMIGIGWYKKSKNDKKIFQYMKEQNNFEKKH